MILASINLSKRLNTMNEHFIKKLLSTIKCSICGEHYEIDNVKVLGHQDNTWFLNAFCPACHSRALVAAVIKEGKSVNGVTDLSEAESAKISETSTISTDDILDIHGFLTDFDGDFTKLFSQHNRAAT